MSALMTPEFWVALAQIVLINIVLSGDNAVVIALACRALPARQQKSAILFGSAGAIVLRVLLTFFAVFLLAQPWLKLVGAALLLWIGIGLLKGEDEDQEHEGQASLWAAIKTIIIADFVMSLDNVIGVAAAAKGDILLLILGLVISIPLIVFGSTLLLKLMGRFPVIITAGAALLGWVAGEMAVSDPAATGFVAQYHFLHAAAPIAGAVIVVGVGKWLERRGGRDDEGDEGDEGDDRPADRRVT
jgi:YjbE family integral membrane protein